MESLRVPYLTDVQAVRRERAVARVLREAVTRGISIRIAHRQERPDVGGVLDNRRTGEPPDRGAHMRRARLSAQPLDRLVRTTLYRSAPSLPPAPQAVRFVKRVRLELGVKQVGAVPIGSPHLVADYAERRVREDGIDALRR